MRRRDFVSVTGTAALGAALAGCSGSGSGSGQSVSPVDTPEARRRFLESRLEEICDLGPRPIGSPAMRQAAAIVERELRDCLPVVEKDPFEFVRWTVQGEPELTIAGTRLEAFPGHGTSGTGPEGLRGRLRRSNADSLPPFALVDSRSGKVAAYLAVSQYGLAVPRPWYSYGLEFGGAPVFNLGRQDSALAAEALEKGLPVYLKDDVEFAPGSECLNVAGHLPGRSGQEILFIAHLDTVYNTPGANDNTASVVAMLMLAQAMSRKAPLERGITFLATTGEEYGKAGAEHYAQVLRRSGGYNNIRFLVNVDSATWGPDFQIYTSDSELWQLVQKIDQQLELPGTPRLAGPDGFELDGSPFRETGARALYVNSTGYELTHLWHRPEDKPETVPVDCVENFFRLMQEYLTRIQSI